MGCRDIGIRKSEFVSKTQFLKQKNSRKSSISILKVWNKPFFYRILQSESKMWWWAKVPQLFTERGESRFK